MKKAVSELTDLIPRNPTPQEREWIRTGQLHKLNGAIKINIPIILYTWDKKDKKYKKK